MTFSRIFLISPENEIICMKCQSIFWEKCLQCVIYWICSKGGKGCVLKKNRAAPDYRIWPNYRTYSYKRTVKQFHTLQITASVVFVYFFIKAYVVGTYLNCINLSMQFKWVPTTYAFLKKIRKKENTIASHKHHLISPSLIFVLVYP